MQSARRIIVDPDQVVQPDRRPWGRTSLVRITLVYVTISAIIVAVGALAGLLLWLWL